MNKELVSPLANALQQQSQGFSRSDLPEDLIESKYISEPKRTKHATCPECGSSANTISTPETQEYDYVVICTANNSHEFNYTKEDLQYFSIQKKEILEDIARAAGLTPSKSFDNRFPGYLIQDTDEDILVGLVGPARDYENAVRSLVNEVVDRQKSAILFTPYDSVKEFQELISPYAAVALIQSFSIRLLKDTELIREQTESIKLGQARAGELLRKREIGEDDIRRELEKNPELVRSKLSTLQTLRRNQKYENPDTELWIQLEKVCKAAFSFIGFGLRNDVGGIDSPGKEVADLIIKMSGVPFESDIGELPQLHGVIDAKSGSEAGFGSERIDKQLEYFAEIKEDEIFDPLSISHLFIVFDVDPEDMMNWYSSAKSSYPRNTGTVVITTNALRQMVNVTQSAIQQAELNIVERDIRDIFRWFFYSELYSSPKFVEISQMPDLEDWGSDDPIVQAQYENENEFLFVTQEMVDEWVRQRLEADKTTERLLDPKKG